MNIEQARRIVGVYNRFKKDLKKNGIIGHNMTEVGVQALTIITRYKKEGRFPMTIRDLRNELGENRNYASNTINFLRDEGLLNKERHSNDERVVYILMSDRQYKKSKMVIAASKLRFNELMSDAMQ